MEAKSEMDEKSEMEAWNIFQDFNIKVEKRAAKKANLYLGFTMKATARDQDKNILISKLKTDLRNSLETIDLLRIENEVKEGLLKLNEQKLESLKEENEKLHLMLKQAQEKPNRITKDKKPSIKICNNININKDKVVSSSVKDEHLNKPRPKEIVTSRDSTLKNTVYTDQDNIGSSKLSLDSKKRAVPKVNKDTNAASNVMYNLRKRTKSYNSNK